MGEAVLADIAKKRGLNIKVDSAGTASYHVGEEPDTRYVLFTCLPFIYVQYQVRYIGQLTCVRRY